MFRLCQRFTLPQNDTHTHTPTNAKRKRKNFRHCGPHRIQPFSTTYTLRRRRKKYVNKYCALREAWPWVTLSRPPPSHYHHISHKTLSMPAGGMRSAERTSQTDDFPFGSATTPRDRRRLPYTATKCVRSSFRQRECERAICSVAQA